jgi:decaprenylphospho-beta-D-erythro-pentofuranosid-2-ulose 2-reductase
MSLSFKNCIILGANSDMAIATCKELLVSKMTINLLSRDPEKTKANYFALLNEKSLSFNAFDLNNPESIISIIDKFQSNEKYLIISFIGVMHNNDSCLNYSNLSLETINSNYTNQVILFNNLLPFLVKNPGSVLVSVSSVAGDRGRASNFIYGSAKAGLTAYLSGLRMLLSKSDVHVITVKPGFVYTKMTKDLNLPKLVTATPEYVAKSILSAVARKSNSIYVSWKWYWIMLIIKAIPEPLFKRLKL